MNKIYLCKPGGTLLGVISGVIEEEVSLTKSITDIWQLTFTVQRYENGIESTYYQSLNEMMELLLETNGEKIRFQINTEPTISSDGVTETKTITASSIEYELSQKYLRNFKINCGTSDSQEYLFRDINGNNSNINPADGLPIDYIVVKNDYASQLLNARNYIDGIDLNLSSNGIVRNEEAAKYLHDLLEEYPRLGCHVIGDEVMVYISSIEKPKTKLGYEIRVGNAEGYTKEMLISGFNTLITFYTEYGNQLSLIDLALENAKISGWSSGDIPQAVRHVKCNFDITEQDILSFFRQSCTQSIKVLFDFDRFNKEVDVIDIQNEGDTYDTGVFLSYQNLVNHIDINTSSTEGIKTEYLPKGSNNLGIEYVNFGEDKIINLNWFMSKVNEYGERQYVSDLLNAKYKAWEKYRDNEPYTTNDGKEYTSRREAYIALTKQYNQYMLDINSIKNLLPNDECELDYTTFSFKDLNIAYKAYKNALNACIASYESDYAIETVELDYDNLTVRIIDSSGAEVPEDDLRGRHILQTMYQYDFKCYFYTIIPNVKNALKMYVKTDDEGKISETNPDQYNPEKSEWIPCKDDNGNIIGNTAFQNNSKIVTENVSDMYKYDMSLYGTVELDAKIKAWSGATGVLYNKYGGMVKDMTVGSATYGQYLDAGHMPFPTTYEYNTADETGWNNLSADQKATYTGQSGFIEYMGRYLDYVSTEERENSLLHGQVSKGVILLAQERLSELTQEIEGIHIEGEPPVKGLQDLQDEVQQERKALADSVSIDNWNNGKYSFDDKDKEIIYTLIRETNYSNENILITNLDNIVKTVDIQKNLYDDAVISLSEKSQPQLSFTIETDNIFAVEEFAEMAKNIKLLNFIRLVIGIYDNEFVKLRIVSIEYNPLINTENLVLGFSNMTYSLNGVSDLAFIFENMNGGGSTSTTSTANYGTNDAEITISNNMLNALLKNVNTGSIITQTVVSNVANNSDTRNTLESSGLLDGFKDGRVQVNADCIKEGKIDTGKVFMDYDTGYFNLANGKLTWDGTTLHVASD